MRSLHFQHHDGESDGNDAVAEGFQACFVHLPVLL
jgi:hypothetical protein